MRASRTRHLIFIAHLWACMPFLVLWITVPSTHPGIPDDQFKQISAFIWVVVAYLLVRTWLAIKDPPKLQWEYVFPPIDVAVVSVLIWLGNRDPLSSIGLLYFFPLAQTSGTLNTRWSLAVAGMILVGAALATHGLRSEEPFTTVFRYFFIFVVGSLVTSLARASANLREQLAVARERNRIALEMHDGVQGHLISASRQLELIPHLDAGRVPTVAAEALESTSSAASELRYLVNRMRSPSLDRGFVEALRAYVHNLAGRHGIEYSFEVQGEEGYLSGEVEHAAFRVAQEALTNAFRHSECTRIDVCISYWTDQFELSVEDNGKGMNMEGITAGIEGMRQRVQAAGGILEITAAPGKGTRVEAKLPRRAKDASTYQAVAG